MKSKLLLTTFMTLFFAFSANAQIICPLPQNIKPKEVDSISELKQMAVLEKGRVKPFDTFAKNMLLQFSGKTSIRYKIDGEKKKIDASTWLSKLLFAPDITKDYRIFLINHPDIVEDLKIEEQKRRLYTLNELEPHYMRIQELAIAASEIDPKNRDIVEQEIMRLYENLNEYAKLSLTFSFAFPHPDFTIQDPFLKESLQLNSKVDQFSFIEIASKALILQKITEGMDTTPQDKWTDQQVAAIALVNNLFQWSMTYQNLPFSVIPHFDQTNIQWLSPWDAIKDGMRDSNVKDELQHLADVLLNYWNGKQVDFNLAVKKFNQAAQKRGEKQFKNLSRNIAIELNYNKIDFFSKSKILYFLALILIICTLTVSSKPIYIFTFIITMVAFLFNTIGLFYRIILLERPPVSNLYETFIFVSFVSALTGFLIEKFQKNKLGLVIASISGFTFLSIAGKFALEGDTLEVLRAVLDSNFWLSTHVISISIGYSGACVAGIIGHVYIIQSIIRPHDKRLLDSTYKILLGSLGFALTMTFLGTNLGGIWADQSWGRFWGWDPKENGALMIVLWTAILFHAKIARMITPLGLAVGSALGIIVVLWAWFGVNLLSIGLHSYGFTTGLAVNLIVYLIVQLLFLFVTVPIAKKRLNS